MSKYKATQLQSGKWAVDAGKNEYWTNEIYDTKEEAIERGLVIKLVDYANKSRDIFDKLVKKHPDTYTYENNNKTNYGDLLA